MTEALKEIIWLGGKHGCEYALELASLVFGPLGPGPFFLKGSSIELGPCGGARGFVTEAWRQLT